MAGFAHLLPKATASPETGRGELPEVNHQSETESNTNEVNSIRPKQDGELPGLRRSPHRAHTSDIAGTRKGWLNGGASQTEESENPMQRSVTILAVVRVGMMRSVCEINRETLPGQIRCSCLRAEEPAGRESEHP